MALLLAVLLAAHELIVNPLLAAYEARAEEREDLVRRLEAYRRMSATRDAVEQRLEALEAGWREAELVFRAGNESRAEAAMQQRLAQVVGASGGRLIRSQMLPGRSEGPLYRVSARLQLRVESGALPQLLHGLHTALPYLTVEELSISGRVSQRAVLSNQIVPPLNVEIVVAGFAELGAEAADDA